MEGRGAPIGRVFSPHLFPAIYKGHNSISHLVRAHPRRCMSYLEKGKFHMLDCRRRFFSLHKCINFNDENLAQSELFRFFKLRLQTCSLKEKANLQSQWMMKNSCRLMLVENHASRLVVEAIFLWIPKWQRDFSARFLDRLLVRL